jgi:hypothetical protein
MFRSLQHALSADILSDHPGANVAGSQRKLRSTALTCAACVDPSLALTSKKNTCISVMPASVRPMREGSYLVRMDLRQPHHRSGVPVVVVRDHVVAVAAGKVFSGDCR